MKFKFWCIQNWNAIKVHKLEIVFEQGLLNTDLCWKMRLHFSVYNVIWPFSEETQAFKSCVEYETEISVGQTRQVVWSITEAYGVLTPSPDHSSSEVTLEQRAITRLNTPDEHRAWPYESVWV